MKLNYTHILLFSLLLNILLLSSEVHNQRNHNSTTYHTPKIPTNRSLCECELYAPANYDNDQEMKVVMENFNKQTQQRFHQYDDRIVEKRMQCKEQCDKEIQKIILKDKIEKELTEKLGALKTDIRTEDIPTCFCEKSLAGKTEKVCLNCGKNMGGVASGWGLLSGIGYVAWTNYVAGIAAKAATKAGIAKAIEGLGNIFELYKVTFMDWTKMVTPTTYDKVMELVKIVNSVNNMCDASEVAENTSFCTASYTLNTRGKSSLFMQQISQQAAKAAADAGEVAKTAGATETAKFATNTSILTNTIIASIIAIVIIVLIMVIIYLILRYRRKKKMKKKHQYIKLLKE
ncbi:rifin PIR protein, putative [Plasmodium reichenowi]|uniref:Rifin PIR protein, putative n=1 Tax=Plasmodium reichenowi TaxID=5854 RepID=A0A2P9DS93_PLARE|nr:rifin PIR protein, putative [Plasmodium reichenowi]